MSEYAIYRDDEFLFVGTLEECAEFLSVKKETVKWLTSPSSRKRMRKIAIKIEEED